MYVIKKRIKRKKQNRMKVTRNLLMIGLSLALAGQTAIAADKTWTFHEDKWKDVKAYGSIPINEDSATEWGPWTQFVQPAAGPLLPAALPAMYSDGSTYFRPESADAFSPKFKLEMPELDFCKGGEWCGYIAYEHGKYVYEGNSTSYGPIPGRIALGLNPDDPNAVTTDGGYGDGTVSFRVGNLSGSSELYQSGDLDASFYDGLANFYGSKSNGAYQSIWGNEPYIYEGDRIREATGGYVSVYEYMDGGEGWKQGYYVAGITTPMTDITNLRAGNVTANYYGRSLGGYSPVHIAVDFGQATWTGSWNHGMDGSVYTMTDSTGTKYLIGRAGFNAGGAVKGANIVSDPAQFSAGDGVIDASKSTVNGNFVSKNAGALIGVVDITKTRSVDSVSVGVSEGYTNARHVDTFIACKGSECSIDD